GLVNPPMVESCKSVLVCYASFNVNKGITMKKVWIIVIAVVAAAAIGFGAWFFLTQFNKAGNSGIQGAGAEIDNSIATLNQAIALNKPITCVYEDDVEKGVAYIAGDSLIRYDFESKVTGETSGGMLLTSSHI